MTPPAAQPLSRLRPLNLQPKPPPLANRWWLCAVTTGLACANQNRHRPRAVASLATAKTAHAVTAQTAPRGLMHAVAWPQEDAMEVVMLDVTDVMGAVISVAATRRVWATPLFVPNAMRWSTRSLP